MAKVNQWYANEAIRDVGHLVEEMNGISVAAMMNFAGRHLGIQVALINQS